MSEPAIERRILIGMLVSEDYLKRIKGIWREDLIPPEVMRLGRWCLSYYQKYGKAPRRDVELHYITSKKEVPKAQLEYLELMLELINEKWETGNGYVENVDALFDQTVAFFNERELAQHTDNLDGLLQRGKIEEARDVARTFKPNTIPQWTRADKIKPRPITWQWQDVILRGDITLLVGRPKVGKSQVTMSIAAIASSGGLWPATETRGRPRDVILMSAEDATDFVMVPRLIANGADLEHVYILDPAEDTETASARIEACLDELPHKGVGALVIIDPISSFMPKQDSKEMSHVRAALRPLSDMARRRKLGLIVVHHLRKATDGDALDAISGSIGFTAAARVIHMVLPDPNQEGRRMMLCVGGNLSANHPGFAFQVVPETIKDDISISRVAWENTPVNATADEILIQTRKAKTKTKKTEAAEWLREQLQAGPRAVTALEEAALEEDFSWATIRIIKNDIGIKVYREGGRHGAWMWALPSYSNGEDKDDPASTAMH